MDYSLPLFQFLGLPKETCLIPNEDNQSPSAGENYNFITECFFLTHQCIHMSFHTVHEKFLKLNQELHRVQRLYNDVRGQGNDEVEPVRSIKRQMEKGNLYKLKIFSLDILQLVQYSYMYLFLIDTGTFAKCFRIFTI